MPTKKPSAKASKAKKTVSAKTAPAKKRVPAKAAAKPAAKPASKAASKGVVKGGKPAPHSKPIAKAVPELKKAAAAAPAKVQPAVAAKPSTKSAASVVVPPTPDKMTPPKPAKVTASLSAANAKNVAVAERRKPIASNGDGDDQDEVNLLAGPRNVTPYQAKRGEQYMNKEQLEHFRNILATWKRDLMEEVDRTVLHMKDEAANFPDPNDRATQESEFSLELRTRDRERKLIRKIDEAIGRIDDGSYGYCVETGEEIGIKRLEARPVATLCVEAQERRERRERQYGDRDDRYR
jgi:DnaK suppressor protein